MLSHSSRIRAGDRSSRQNPNRLSTMITGRRATTALRTRSASMTEITWSPVSSRSSITFAPASSDAPPVSWMSSKASGLRRANAAATPPPTNTRSWPRSSRETATSSEAGPKPQF